MKKIKGVFDSDAEMFAAKDALVANYLAKGGKITYVKPSFAEIRLDDEPVKKVEEDVPEQE